MMSKTVNSPKPFQRYLSRVLSICIFSGFFYASVCGLDRDRTLSQLHHSIWTSKEGAPPGPIRAIAQTGDGYLWLGTSSGLYRFDGVRFEFYVPRSGGNFPSNNIYTLSAAPDGGLWISYMYRDTSFLKDGNVTNYGEAEGLPQGAAINFAIDHEGTVWAAYHRFGLYRLEGQRWQHIGTEWGYPGKFAQTVFVDKDSTVWVATEDTIVFLPQGASSFQSTGEKIDQVHKMAQSPDGKMWIADTMHSVRQLRLPGIDPRSLGPEIQVGSMDLRFDRESALWVTSVGDGLRRVPYTDRFRGKKIAQFSTDAEIFTEEDGLSGDYIWTIFEDREGNIWLGTANGLDCFRDNAVVPIRFPPAEPNFGLAAGSDGEVWITSYNLGIMHTQGAAPTKISTNYKGTNSIFRDKDGTLWAGGNGSIFAFKEEKGVVIKTPASLKISYVLVMFKDRVDRVWAYSGDGFFLLKDGLWEAYDRQSELPKVAPLCATVDSSDRKWICYPRNVLTVIDGDRIRNFSRDDGLEVGDVKAVYERSGRVWVAGTRGLALFEADRFRMLVAEGTNSLSDISGIVEARDGSLWLNASRGVIHIQADEVRRFLENPAYSVNYRVFDFLDGLPGTAQQIRPTPTAIEGSDGRLWFSTTQGIAWIDPQKIPRNTLPPPVLIGSVYANEKLYESSPSLELPKGTTRLQINFTALSLSVPERVRFRYRLEGVDNEWQDTGGKRETTYTNLSPGNYRFRVIAGNNDGIWNEEGAIWEFSIAPMFYQTLWFRAPVFILTLLLTGLFLHMLYRWRVQMVTDRLNANYKERLAERTRIAHELHDTLLQGFLGVSMRLQAVSNLLPGKSAKAKENLDNVLDQIDVVLEDGRRAIWDVHPSSAVEDDLEKAFTLVSEDLNKTYPTNFLLTIEGASRALHPFVRDPIYRIGREALINAFRHSRAERIELEIEYAAKHLRLVIRDDGNGMDSDVLRTGREEHLGLPGMRKYAEKIGAELKIRSRAESGTEIELIVPHQIAFVKKSSRGFRKRLSRLFNRQARPSK